MKCPKCGNELRESKKSPGYFLCDSCKKKFSQETLNRFQNKKPVRKKETAPSTPVEEDPKPAALEQTYSNIPPEEVRNEREKEMRNPPMKKSLMNCFLKSRVNRLLAGFVF